MNSPTYESLPSDVREGLGNTVAIDESIPTGQVVVYGEDGAEHMPVAAFVRARRRARKAERQNRKRGRRG